MFSFKNVKDQVGRALENAGVVFSDENAKLKALNSLEAIMPDDELFTSQELDNEVTEKIRDVRNEAKENRELAESLIEKVTGKKKGDFEEENRRQKMIDEANNKIDELQTKNDELQGTVKQYQDAEAEEVNQSWTGVKENLDTIFSDEEVAGRFKERFNFPEDGKELTVEEKKENVKLFNQLQGDGIPAFQTESVEKSGEDIPLSQHEDMPLPRKGSEKEEVQRQQSLSREELDKERGAVV